MPGPWYQSHKTTANTLKSEAQQMEKKKSKQINQVFPAINNLTLVFISTKPAR